MNTLTASQLRKLLKYDPETGIFTRLVRTSNRINAGDIAGCRNDKGYLIIRICGRMQKASRLAWLYMTGEWPRSQIDHRNGITDDNRFSNLRDVSQAVNQQNKHRATRISQTGFLGASPIPSGFRAQININGRVRYLGSFRTAELAHAAYLEAKRKYHEGNTL